MIFHNFQQILCLFASGAQWNEQKDIKISITSEDHAGFRLNNNTCKYRCTYFFVNHQLYSTFYFFRVYKVKIKKLLLQVWRQTIQDVNLSDRLWRWTNSSVWLDDKTMGDAVARTDLPWVISHWNSHLWKNQLMIFFLIYRATTVIDVVHVRAFC